MSTRTRLSLGSNQLSELTYALDLAISTFDGMEDDTVLWPQAKALMKLRTQLEAQIAKAN